MIYSYDFRKGCSSEQIHLGTFDSKSHSTGDSEDNLKNNYLKRKPFVYSSRIKVFPDFQKKERPA